MPTKAQFFSTRISLLYSKPQTCKKFTENKKPPQLKLLNSNPKIPKVKASHKNCENLQFTYSTLKTIALLQQRHSLQAPISQRERRTETLEHAPGFGEGSHGSRAQRFESV